MQSAREANKPGHITTGNVLEDLGFSAEEIREMEIQHSIWVPIRAEIEARKLTQAQVGKALQIHQPDASLLLRGQIARFSITRLMQFANRLGLAVKVAVIPKSETENPSSAPRIPARRTSSRRASAGPADSSRSKRKVAQA
jgi:predicted XRE-type DNA-binding protein